MSIHMTRRAWLQAAVIGGGGFWGRMAVAGGRLPPIVLPSVRQAQLGEQIRTEKTPLVVRLGQDALWLRPNTQIELVGDVVLKEVRVLSGQLLAVFGAGEKCVTGKNAVAGIRGTAIFWAERDDGQTYFCLCYGNVELDNRKGNQLLLAAQHHQARFIPLENAAAGVGWRYAPFWGHRDEELVLLEQLCGRTPPFVNR